MINQDLQTKLRQRFGEVLAADQESSIIPNLMHQRCKVSVLIPAYGEEIGTLARALTSLAIQEQVAFENFEVVIIVNNSKLEAAEQTAAFLANQEILKFLADLKNLSVNEFKPEINIIKSSGLIIHTIDKSSLGNSDKQNHIGHARNRGCMEITNRFLATPAGTEGVISMIDCDCRVSPNYISSIINSFDRNSFLNGLSGAIQHEVDESLPYSESVQKAFDQHVGFSGRFSLAKKYNAEIVFKKQHKFSYFPLNTGQDMAVRAKAWLLAGGFPDRPSGEDFHFGQIVEKLDGDVGVTDGYTVFPLIRESNRAGLASYGRRVSRIVQAVKNFHEGKSTRVIIPDINKQNSLFRVLSDCGREGKLTSDNIGKLMEEHGSEISNLKPQSAQELAEMLNQELSKPGDEPNYTKIEDFFAKELVGCLPEKDITHIFENS